MKQTASVELFRGIFQYMSSGVVIYEARDNGTDFVIKDANQAFERIDRLRRADVIGRSVQEVFPGVREFGILEVWQRVWRTGQPEHHPIARYRDARITGWRENYIFKLPSGEIVTVYDDITEQKQAEEALQQSEQRFRAIFNSTFQFIGLLRPDGTVLEINQTALDFGGLTLADVQGRPFWDCYWWCLSAETQAALKESVSRAAAGEFIRDTVEVWGRRQTHLTIDFSLKPIYDEEGRVSLLLAEGRDIMELKRAEKRYRQLFDMTPAATFLHADGIIVQANAAGLALLGAESPDDVLGRSVTSFVLADDLPMIEARLRDIARGEKSPPDMVARIRRLDDREAIVAIRTRIVAIGDKPSALTFLLDISDRVQAEAALKESEERFARIFRHSPGLVAVTRLADGIFLDVNLAFEETTGYRREEVLGRSSLDLNIWVDPEQRLQVLERLRTEGVAQGLEVKIRRQDGSVFDGLISAVTIKVAGEELLLTMIIDITLRKRAEEVLAATEKASREHAQELAAANAELRLANEKLRDMDRHKSEFLTSISHELRTPVATTQVAVENLLRGMAGNITEPQRHLLNIAGRNYARLGRLIDNLLDLSRLDAQALTLRLASVDLREAVERAVETFRPIVERDKLRLEWEAPAEPFVARADHDKIIQIASNLIDNARRFARQVIAVNMEKTPDGAAVIRFRDDGPGVADKDLPVLFQRFTRLDKDDGKGHIGLGLSIVRSLVEAHGGRAYAENGQEGTAFVVVIPLGEARKPPPI